MEPIDDDVTKKMNEMIAEIRPHNGAVDTPGFCEDITAMSEAIGETPSAHEVEQAAIWYARGFSASRARP